MKRLLMLVVLCMVGFGGCAMNAAKGNGSLFAYKSEMKIGEAPSTFQGAWNDPFNPDAGRPANTVAGHKPPNPMSKAPKATRRAARN